MCAAALRCPPFLCAAALLCPPLLCTRPSRWPPFLCAAAQAAGLRWPPFLCTRPGRWPSALQRSRMAQVPPLLSSGPYLLAQEQRPSVLWPSVLQSSVQWRLCCGPPVWRRSLHCMTSVPPLLAQVRFYRGGLRRKCGFCAFQWRRSYRKNRTCTGELGDLHHVGGGPAPHSGREQNRYAALPRDLRRTVGKLFSQGGGLSHSGYFSHEKKLPILLKSLSGVAIWRFL